MGTIAQELTRIQTAKTDIKTSIEAKGVQVPSNALISTYDTYIDQIQTGGGSNISDFDNARYLFYYGRFVDSEADFLAHFVGNDCSLLANYITDSTKKMDNATLNKWVKKAIDNANTNANYTNVAFNGMINNSTVYAGDTLTFDYSNYECSKNIGVSLAAFFNVGSTDGPSKLTINLDNKDASQSGYRFYINALQGMGANLYCPHIELFAYIGNINLTLNTASLVNNPTHYDKLVIKNDTGVQHTVTAGSTVTDLTTWQNSLQYYADNEDPIRFAVTSTVYYAIHGTQLETDYANYNVTFTVSSN